MICIGLAEKNFVQIIPDIDRFYIGKYKLQYTELISEVQINAETNATVCVMTLV